MAVLRRQWVDRERLPFPLAEAPLTMLEEVEAGKIQAFCILACSGLG